jgi:hypothetical protein
MRACAQACVRACVLASVPAYCVPAACQMITGEWCACVRACVACVRAVVAAVAPPPCAGDAHTFVRACVARSDCCAPADGGRRVRSFVVAAAAARGGWPRGTRRCPTMGQTNPVVCGSARRRTCWQRAHVRARHAARASLLLTADGGRRSSPWIAVAGWAAPPAGICHNDGPANGGSCGVGGRAAAGGVGQAVVAARAGDARVCAPADGGRRARVRTVRTLFGKILFFTTARTDLACGKTSRFNKKNKLFVMTANAHPAAQHHRAHQPQQQ